MRIYIPFGQRWRNIIPNGEKICTSRTKKYGDVGDYFEEYNCIFEIIHIEKRSLSEVANELYRFEGCDTPSSFIRIWEELHPRKKFVPEQMVFVHWFGRK